MASLNALRGLLVAGAAAAAVLAAIGGRWPVAGLMVVAVAVHAGGSLWLRQRAASRPVPSAGASTTDVG